MDTTRPADPVAAGLEVDVERQTRIMDDDSSKSKCTIVLFLVYIAAVVCVVVPAIYYMEDTHYSVAIDSASSVLLDPKTGVSFNLTLVIASRSHGAKACLDPTIFIQVFYHGVQIATTDPAATTTTTPQICARPRNVAELSPVMARATMLPVGQMQDCLAAEMGQGAALFDLRLINIPSYGERGLVLDCKGSRVGDAAVPCHE